MVRPPQGFGKRRQVQGLLVVCLQPLGQRRYQRQRVLNQPADKFVGNSRGQTVNGFDFRNLPAVFRGDDIIRMAHLPTAVEQFGFAADQTFAPFRQVFADRIGIGFEKNERQFVSRLVFAQNLIGLLAAFGSNMFDYPDQNGVDFAVFESMDGSRPPAVVDGIGQMPEQVNDFSDAEVFEQRGVFVADAANGRRRSKQGV